MAKVGINGFGRIGKLLLRSMIERQPTKLIPCAINDPGLKSPKYAAYIFKHDSIHGKFYGKICSDQKHLIVNEHKIAVYNEADSKKIPWVNNDVQYVAECSGKNTTIHKAKDHIKGKVKKVVISAASPDAPMFVVGVNENAYKPSDMVVSMAACCTNCIAPLAKVVHERYGIREGIISTIHSVTKDDSVLDGFSENSWRAGRACISNIIPASTGAGLAIAKVLPDLKGKITGMAFKVPMAIGCVIGFTIRICSRSKLEEINDTIKGASKCSLHGILCYTDEPVVSTDFRGSTCSSIYDATASIQLNEHFFKLVAWCDNEYGYVCRLADFLAFIYGKDMEEACKKKEQK